MHNTSKYYYEIDILRGIACLLVVFSHLPIYRILGSEAFVFSGAIGVFLFFVISGFIITKTFSDKVIKIDNFNYTEWRSAFIQNYPQILSFWYRRFLRLFPVLCLLFCCIGVISLRYGIRNHDVIMTIIGFFRYIASIIFTNNVVARLSGQDKTSIEDLICYSFGAGVTWTLTCEILFYLLFPCVIIFKRFIKILPILFIIGLIIKGIAFALLSNSVISFESLYYNQLGHFDLFIIGISIAIYHEKVKINYTLLKVIVCVSLYTIIFPAPKAEFISYRYYLDFVFASACLVYAASIQKNILNFPIVGSILNFIGVRSYFIYLMHIVINYIMHKPFVWLFKYLSKTIHILEILLIKNSLTLDHIRHILVLIITIILADLFYRFVEKPFIERNKHKVFT